MRNLGFLRRYRFFEMRCIELVEITEYLLFQLLTAIVIHQIRRITKSYYREVRKGKAPKNAPTYVNSEPAGETAGEKEKFKCLICGHIYDPALGDPEHNVPAGTDYSDLSDDWKCPVCGTDKYSFDLI